MGDRRFGGNDRLLGSYITLKCMQFIVLLALGGEFWLDICFLLYGTIDSMCCDSYFINYFISVAIAILLIILFLFGKIDKCGT